MTTKQEREYDLIIGRRVAKIRERSGMSQTELSKQLGISPQQLSKQERGTNRFSVGRICKILEILDVSIKE